VVNYIRQQSAGDVLRNMFAIYGRGFGVIFLTYLLPIIPFSIWQTEASAARATGSWLIAFFLGTIVRLLAFGAITISVSDICLGNAPSLIRSYKKVFRLFVKMFTASFLQLMFDLIGLVLLIVPGVIAILWFMFTPCVVVLEGLGGLTALKRSKAIGQGYNWRNLGIIVLLIVIWIVIYVILAVPFVLLFPHAVGHFGARLFEVIVGSLGAPLTIIGIVLMYYDLRVRKEAYDAAALAEDLRR